MLFDNDLKNNINYKIETYFNDNNIICMTYNIDYKLNTILFNCVENKIHTYYIFDIECYDLICYQFNNDKSITLL